MLIEYFSTMGWTVGRACTWADVLPSVGKCDLRLPLKGPEFLFVCSACVTTCSILCPVRGSQGTRRALTHTSKFSESHQGGQSTRCNEKWLREMDLYSPRKRRHRVGFLMLVLYTTCNIKAFQYQSKESFYKISKFSFFHKKNFNRLCTMNDITWKCQLTGLQKLVI